MLRHQDRSAFVIRIWWEETVPAQEMRWRGWVQHVHSAESIYFQDVTHLLTFIEQWTGNLKGKEQWLNGE